MTVYYGSNATKRDNQNIKALIGPGETAGRLRVAYDSYALTADLVGGTDTIRMMKLPKGARVIDVILEFDDLDGSGGTLDVGWEASADAVVSADPDGFLANVDVATAAGLVTMQDDQPTLDGLFKQFDAEVQVTISPDGDTDATSGNIKLCILYVTD